MSWQLYQAFSKNAGPNKLLHNPHFFNLYNFFIMKNITFSPPPPPLQIHQQGKCFVRRRGIGLPDFVLESRG